MLETLREVIARKEISMELFISSQQKIEWEIMKSPHRRRLVCGEKCYQELLEIVESYKVDKRQKKCQRAGCKHGERMHGAMVYGTPCQAARCKCQEFMETLPDQIAMEVNPKIQKMIEEAKKL